MTPGVYDFDLVRGTTSPFVFQLKTTDDAGAETNMPYEDVRLTLYANGEFLFRKSLAEDTLESDSDNAEIMWTPTVEESRLIPQGRNTRYEVEVRYAGGQEVYLVGAITGLGGLNDD